MENVIRVFKQSELERLRLEAVAALLTAWTPEHLRFMVGEVYFDHGQDWEWTTILKINSEYPANSCLNVSQAIYPTQQEILISDNLDGVMKVIMEKMRELNQMEML